MARAFCIAAPSKYTSAMFFALYFALGATAGVLAGLLGVGGGLLIVPALMALFHAQQVTPDYIAHLAVGTSLGIIVFTAAVSSYSHARRHAVDWHVVARITPGIVVGGLLGSTLAARLSSRVLTLVFAVFVVAVATQLFLGIRPKPERRVPGRFAMVPVGALIGGISALVGIGGGSLSVPFLTWCNVRIHRAVGTSAAIGFPIAFAGAAGYVVNGLHVPGRPPWSVGFVDLPALALVALGSIVTVPLGAHLAHRLPVERLTRVFAVFMYLIAMRMVWRVI